MRCDRTTHVVKDVAQITYVYRIIVIPVGIFLSIPAPMSTQSSPLSPVDYVILAVFLLASVGIGIYHSLTGGRQRTTTEFILADRRLGVIPTAISLFVSFTSAIQVLGASAEMFQFGVQYLVWNPVGMVFATIVNERLIVPWIYPLQLVSIFDVSTSMFIQQNVENLIPRPNKLDKCFCSTCSQLEGDKAEGSGGIIFGPPLLRTPPIMIVCSEV